MRVSRHGKDVDPGERGRGDPEALRARVKRAGKTSEQRRNMVEKREFVKSRKDQKVEEVKRRGV